MIITITFCTTILVFFYYVARVPNEYPNEYKTSTKTAPSTVQMSHCPSWVFGCQYSGVYTYNYNWHVLLRTQEYEENT